MSGIYESIKHSGEYPAKIFMTGIQNSCFHWHYDYELLLVLKGSLYTYCGPQPRLLKAGDILLINSKAVHGYNYAGEENLCLFIQLSRELFDRFLEKGGHYYFYLDSTSNSFRPTLPLKHFISLFARIGQLASESGTLMNLRTTSLIYTLLADLLEHVQYDIRYYPAGQQVEQGELTERINQYIEQNLHREDLPAGLYKHIGMSERTVYRHLKGTLGMTLKELIDTERMEKSKNMLAETDKSVSLIADFCGFPSKSTFYRLFKKNMGITPVEYRSGGGKVSANGKIQGYLHYDDREKKELLEKFIYDESI